jgi:hypothetical protein
MGGNMSLPTELKIQKKSHEDESLWDYNFKKKKLRIIYPLLFHFLHFPFFLGFQSIEA